MPKSAQFGRARPKFGEIGLKFATVGPNSAKSCDDVVGVRKLACPRQNKRELPFLQQTPPATPQREKMARWVPARPTEAEVQFLRNVVPHTDWQVPLQDSISKCGCVQQAKSGMALRSSWCSRICALFCSGVPAVRENRAGCVGVRNVLVGKRGKVRAGRGAR